MIISLIAWNVKVMEVGILVFMKLALGQLFPHEKPII